MIKPATKKIFLLSLFTLTCFFTNGCGKKEQTPEMPVEVPVKTIVIESGGSSYNTYPAKVSAGTKVDLSFRVAGPLIERPVKEGTEVKKGHLLARIDPRDFQTAFDAEKAVFLKAEADFKRYRQLFEDQVIAAIEFDRKRKEFDVAKSKLENAKDNLKDTYLNAPFDGRIAEIFVENFQDVQAKQPVMSLHDISKVELIIDMPENEIAAIKNKNIGRTVAIFSSAPNEEFDIELKEFKINADKLTQTYRITFLMDQPDEINVLPGMSAIVKRYLPVEEGFVDQYVIPFHAVFADENDNSFVWVVDPEKLILIKCEIKLGKLTDSGNITVISGLNKGDRIVIAGISHLHEGQKVSLIDIKKN